MDSPLIVKISTFSFYHCNSLLSTGFTWHVYDLIVLSVCSGFTPGIPEIFPLT